MVVEGGGWPESGESGWEVAAPPLLVPTSSAATAAGEADAAASGKSTDWIRRTNMMAGFAGPLGPFPSFWLDFHYFGFCFCFFNNYGTPYCFVFHQAIFFHSGVWTLLYAKFA